MKELYNISEILCHTAPGSILVCLEHPYMYAFQMVGKRSGEVHYIADNFDSLTLRHWKMIFTNNHASKKIWQERNIKFFNWRGMRGNGIRATWMYCKDEGDFFQHFFNELIKEKL